MTSSQKLIVASFDTGLQTEVPAFLLDNDAFPQLENAYLFRKRVLKKRGTKQIGRLQRQLATLPLGSTNGSGAFTGNIVSILGLETNATIASGTLIITVGSQVFTESGTPNGSLSNGGAGVGTINYTTGAVTIQTSPVLVTTAITISVSYYPLLPVMGILSYVSASQSAAINFPMSVYFDTKYAYQFNYSTRGFENISFYKMASNPNPVAWSGADYQQFLSINYQNAMFVTNNVPGFHYKLIAAITTAAAAQLTITAHGLIAGDRIFINEVTGMSQINGLSATVLSVVDANNLTVDINSSTFTAYVSGGIAQYLTSSIAGQDGIKWFDGFGTNFGFVNFAPPLQNFDQILLPNPAYLVGARILIVYQNRMLACGTYEANSQGIVQYYPNRVRYSEIGTVFYCQPVPAGQGVDNLSWVDNIPGKGGSFDIDSTEKILTASVTQEVIVLGLESTQRKVIGTSNPLNPYITQTINPEFGSESTFSSIALDRGILSIGDYGFVLTTSYDAQRFDLKIPDEVYQIKNINNGNDRVCAIRDFRNGFIYFTYPSFKSNNNFPNRTLLFNYVENNFAIFKEEYTTYGTFREQSSLTWATLPFRTWRAWTQSWASGKSAARYPNIAGGNAQGFVIKKDVGTTNDNAYYIKSLSTNTIVSPNHNRVTGDYIRISRCIGSTNLNGLVVKIINVSDVNTFTIDATAIGSYLGLGVYAVIDNFSIKTKLFPLNWGAALASRIGCQRFLLSTTSNGELTVDIFASQNAGTPVNNDFLSPYLVSSNIVRTRPDDSLGLHDAAAEQAQIWHRLSSSFTGDSIQLGFRLSETQLRSPQIYESEFALFAILVEFYTSRILA